MSSIPVDVREEAYQELKEIYKREIRNVSLTIVLSPPTSDLALMTVLQVDRKTFLVDILREIAGDLEKLTSL